MHLANEYRAGLVGPDHIRQLAAAAAEAATAIKQGWHTAWIPAGAMTPRLTSGAAPGLVETATNRLVLSTLDFDTAVSEYAQFTIAMPKSWDRGPVKFQYLWTAASGSGGVCLTLQAVSISDDDPLDVDRAPGAALTDTLLAANDLHVSAISGNLTVNGSPAVGDLTVFEVRRDVGDPADTLAVDAKLIGIRLLFNVNAGTDA